MKINIYIYIVYISKLINYTCPVAPSRHSARSAPQKRSGNPAFPATGGRWAKPRQP